MTISMYDVAVGTFTRVLNNLSAVLAKGAAHAEARKIEPSVLLNCRLYPDMFPLTRQVQIASDGAKGCVARLAGVEPPSFADNESSFAELELRIRKTLDYVQSFKPEQINGSEKRAITLKLRNGEMNFEGMPYLLDFVLPNLYFHASTSYNILRHNGVELGKMDFLGKP